MTAYYNEIDPFAAAWLRELIKAGHIAPGIVDERSIEDIKPNELTEYTQCHFFAGIGVWSYALCQAGWPDDRAVWTGSCPCQPFSAAGKRKGASDERHLWPAFYYLVSICRPVAVFGEQVASKDGLSWLGTVQADLENADYEFGAVDLCAAGFGAPHIRQRLYFVADSNGRNARPEGLQRSGQHGQFEEDGGVSSTVVNSSREQMGLSGCSRQSRGSLENARYESERRLPVETSSCVPEDGGGPRSTSERSSSSFWSACEWLPCVDGKSRPVEAGTFPLAHGIANRVGKLRGYGNSLVAPVAQAFIESYLEVEAE